MSTSRFMAGASRFAHLAGLARPSRSTADDSSSRRRRASDEDEDRAEDEDEDEDEAKGKRSRRAEDDDGDDGKQGRRAADDDGDEDDDRAEDGDDDPKGKRSRRAADDDDGDDDRAEDEDEPKGKRSRRAADDDDDEDAEDDDDEKEMNGKGANASARRREQRRIAHILGHKAAATNVALAVSLACETRMTRRQAVAVLRGQADRGGDRDEDRGTRHARRDRAERNPRLGSDVGAPRGHQAIAASWSAAFERVGIAPVPKR